MPRVTKRSRPETDKAARPAEGGLIGFDTDGAIGWARFPDAPAEMVPVVLKAGGMEVARTVANRFGDPRIETLTGPGVAGFVTILNRAPACPVPFQLSAHVARGADGAEAAPLGAALPVRNKQELAALMGRATRGEIQGHLDSLHEGFLHGWARDGANPELCVQVEVLDGAVVVAAGPANRLREDLREAGLHSGLYGFSIPLPARLLDGRTHSLTARVIGDDKPLPGGPVVFGPTTAVAVLREVADLREAVTRLATLVDGLVAPDGAAQRRMMQMLAERVAAFGEIQREQAERDLAALRAMVLALAGRMEAATDVGAGASLPKAATRGQNAGTTRRRR